jgi:hypothetical protein
VGIGLGYMVMCPCHGMMYVDHGEVALPSVLVEPLEATMVLPELPLRPPPMLLFLLSLPPSFSPLRWLLFLFLLLLLLGDQNDVEGYCLVSGVVVLV